MSTYTDTAGWPDRRQGGPNGRAQGAYDAATARSIELLAGHRMQALSRGALGPARTDEARMMRLAGGAERVIVR